MKSLENPLILSILMYFYKVKTLHMLALKTTYLKLVLQNLYKKIFLCILHEKLGRIRNRIRIRKGSGSKII